MGKLGGVYSRELLEQFPAGIVILDSENRIEYVNQEMMDILEENSENLIGKRFEKLFRKNIKDFEYKKSEGAKILRGHLQEVDGGYLGCFVNVSDLDRYKDLFDRVPAGVYRIDEDNRISLVNDGFVRIFGYSSIDDVIGRNVGELYLSKGDMDKFIKELKARETVTDRILDMKKKNGEKIIISASSSIVREGGRIEREGTILDVTDKMEYFRALEEMPTGYYKVENKLSGRQEIIKCNEAFAELFGYSKKGIIGMDISELYANPEEMKKFLQELEEAEERNHPLKDYVLKVKKKDGTEFYIEIDCHILRDARGREIGRHGTVRDITDRIQLQQTIEKMDQFVHQYITPLISIETFTEALVELLEPIIGLTCERAKRLDPCERLADEFVEMLKTTMPIFRRIDVPENILTDIESHVEDIEKRKEQFSNEIPLMDLWTREHVFQIISKFQYIPDILKGKLPEDVANRMRKVEEKGLFILKIYAMKQQDNIFTTARITHNIIESLRFYLLKGKEQGFDIKEENIYPIIRRSIELLYSPAQHKGLEFRYKGEKDVRARIAREHFERLMSNLLMNAVKYSYTREDGFIDILVEEKDKNVKIEISNYGVPIRKDEIDKVFEYGYRGVFSRDWNRMGSGIGLADAKIVINKLGGKIDIDSIPSQPGHFGDYTIPYITIVTVYVPKEVKKNEKSSMG
jgi:PAS domain S-box-containing protein